MYVNIPSYKFSGLTPEELTQCGDSEYYLAKDVEDAVDELEKNLEEAERNLEGTEFELQEEREKGFVLIEIFGFAKYCSRNKIDANSISETELEHIFEKFKHDMSWIMQG